MSIAVLRPLMIDGTTAPIAPRDRVVLTALALSPGETVSAEQLADALWPDQPPATWTKVVQGSVMRLRRFLGAQTIQTVPGGYRLAVPAREVDAHEFERLVERARELLLVGEPERASYAVDHALALWRGRALMDVADWDPGRIEADRLDELRRDAEELHLEAALQTGHHRRVLAQAHALVKAAPLRERHPAPGRQ